MKRTFTIAQNVLVWVVIIVGWSIGIFILMHNNRTEVYSQRHSLKELCNTNNNEIEKIILVPGDNPSRIAELSIDKDKNDIKKLMLAIRNDLWVSWREKNPYGKNIPTYDEIRLNLKGKGTLTLLCWFGKEGGKNVSLSTRSRTGEFKRVVQDIMRRKGKSIK